MRPAPIEAQEDPAAPAVPHPVVLLLGPALDAMSGVSTHLNMLRASRLREHYELHHFQVGSEGRNESAPGRWARLLGSPFRLAATLLKRRVAVVHINTSLNVRAYWRDLAYLIVAKVCGVRVLYQVHGGSLPQAFCEGSRLFALFLRRSLLLPDAIAVLARSELRAYRDFVQEQQVSVVPNGVDYASYARFDRLPRADPAALQLLYIGRLSPEKGLYELLQGLALARRRGARARLVVAGNGPEEAGLRHRADELNLGSDTAFVGAAFGESKLRLLASADVLVLPSYSEGLPYALLEGMAAGLPVIATPVGAIPDVMIDRLHGRLVPVRDAAAIGDAIVELASDSEALERMSVACRKRICAGYSLAQLSERFSQLYFRLGAGSRAKALTRRNPVIR